MTDAQYARLHELLKKIVVNDRLRRRFQRETPVNLMKVRVVRERRAELRRQAAKLWGSRTKAA